MTSLKSQERASLSILFSVTALMLILYGQINYTMEPYASWDLASYLRMASASPNIDITADQPYAFRLLGPYLVGLLPIPEPLGFSIFTILGTFLLVFLFYRFLRDIKLSPLFSVIATMFFVFNRYWLGFMIWDYFQINDLLSLIWIIVLFRAMLKDQWALFGIAFFLGAITREPSILMMPVAFAYLLETKCLSSKWHKALLATLPGLTIFLLLRVLFPFEGGHNLLEAPFINAGRLFMLKNIYRLSINSFIPLTFVPFICFETTLRFFETKKYMLLFVVLVFVGSLFGGDNERLLAPMFIVFYALIGTIIQELKSGKILITIFIICGFLSSFHHLYARYPLPSINWTYLLSFGSLFTVTVGTIIYRMKYRNHNKLPLIDNDSL